MTSSDPPEPPGSISDRQRRQRADYLSSHEVPCAGCGYDLKGTLGDRCPECGLAVRWPVRGSVHRGMWKFGAIGLIATFVLLVSLALTAAWTGNLLLAILASVLLIDGPRRITRWMRTRRAFGELPRHIRQQLVACWWLAALAPWYCGPACECPRDG